jgi:hypothetical protein
MSDGGRWSAAQTEKFNEICRGQRISYKNFRKQWPYEAVDSKRFYNKVAIEVERAAKKRKQG